MYYSGSNILVKLKGGPFETPVISAKFTFPITKLQVTIDQGKLTYSTADGTDSFGVHGFCMDMETGMMEKSIKTREECQEKAYMHGSQSIMPSHQIGIIPPTGIQNGLGKTNNNPIWANAVGVYGHQRYTWTPYIQASTATTLQEIQLSHQHLNIALDDMLVYYESAYVQLADYNALKEWVDDIKKRINENQGTYNFAAGAQKFNPGTYHVGSVDIKQARILDALALNFSVEQSSVPLYNPGSAYMETQMRGNTMVQGSLTMNFDSFDVLDLINHHDLMDLEVHYFDDEFEKNEFSLNPEYTFESEARTYTFHDVRFISKQHATSPSPENITETLGFIAKTLSWTSI